MGIWAGQTVLLPASKDNKPQAILQLASGLWKNTQKEKASAPDTEEEKQFAVQGELQGKTEKEWSPQQPEEESLFSLQVASFRDQKEAHRAVLGWQARGHDAFFLSPEDDSALYRVFIGSFEKLAEANQMASNLEDAENVRAYITLLPKAEINKRKQ